MRQQLSLASGRISLLTLLLLLPLQASAQVRALSLQEMTSSAGTIFVGTVTDTRGGVDQNDDVVTYTTFRIDQAIHHASGSSVTIKQYGGVAKGLNTRLAHMRYFDRGEQVLVMLYPTSPIGFTSPIGMGQGVWNISNGRVQGVTAYSLRGLESLMQQVGVASPAVSGPVPLAPFVSLIRRLIPVGGSR